MKEPVHICWGDADAVSPAKVARYLKEHVCPRARLTLMPGAGHFCQLSDPDVGSRVWPRFTTRSAGSAEWRPTTHAVPPQPTMVAINIPVPTRTGIRSDIPVWVTGSIAPL